MTIFPTSEAHLTHKKMWFVSWPQRAICHAQGCTLNEIPLSRHELKYYANSTVLWFDLSNIEILRQNIVLCSVTF